MKTILNLKFKILNSRSHRGVLVMYAMLVVAGLTAAIAAYATITIGRIEQGKNVNRALSSFYAAESSAEQALYFIKKEQASGTLDTTFNRYDIASGSPQTFTDSGVKFFRNAHTLLPEIVISHVPTNGVIPVELYDPLQPSRGACYQADGSYPIGTPDDECVKSLELEWKSNDPVDVEVRWVAWENNNYGTTGTGGTVIEGGYTGTINLLDSALYNPRIDVTQVLRYNNFRVRIRPLFGDMYSVIIRAKNWNNLPVQFPGFFVVDATGFDGTNRQKVRLAVPQQEIAAPWWDFVFFVEGYTR